MSEMKDSEIDWIGKCPTSWQFLKGKYIFTLRNDRGNTIELQLLSPTQKFGVIPQSLFEELTTNTTVKVKENTDLSQFKTIHKGDFCISLRSFQGGFEYCAYEGVVSPAYQVFYPTTKICDNYYKYLFKDQSFISKMNSYTLSLRDGKNIAFTDFGNTYLPIPPLSEQEIISSFLDEKCLEIDKLFMDIQSEIDSLEEYRMSIINEVLRCGISGKSKHKEVRFKYIATVKANLVPPTFFLEYPQASPENITKNTGKLLSYSTVEDSGIISGNHLFYKGQIIYSKIRPNLNKAIIAPFDGLCSADMYPIEAKINSKYLLYAMLSRHFVEQVTLIMQDRVKMPKINQDELGNIGVYIAPDIEQKEIVLYLDKKCAEIDSIIETKKEQLTVLNEYKKAIIYEYVTGKKEVV